MYVLDTNKASFPIPAQCTLTGASKDHTCPSMSSPFQVQSADPQTGKILMNDASFIFIRIRLLKRELAA